MHRCSGIKLGTARQEATNTKCDGRVRTPACFNLAHKAYSRKDVLEILL